MKTNPVIAVIAGIVACFVTIAVCSTVVYAVDSEAAADFLTPVLGFAGTTLALIAGLVAVTRKQEETARQLDDVKRDVTYLANGGMDAKVRAGVADVLPDHLLDPEAAEQIEADRAYREAGPSGAPEAPAP